MLTVDSDLNGGMIGREGTRGNGVETPCRRCQPGDKTGSLKVSAVVEDAAAAGGHLEVKNDVEYNFLSKCSSICITIDTPF